MEENVHLLSKEILSKSNIKVYDFHSENEGASRIFEILKVG